MFFARSFRSFAFVGVALVVTALLPTPAPAKNAPKPTANEISASYRGTNPDGSDAWFADVACRERLSALDFTNVGTGTTVLIRRTGEKVTIKLTSPGQTRTFTVPGRGLVADCLCGVDGPTEYSSQIDKIPTMIQTLTR